MDVVCDDLVDISTILLKISVKQFQKFLQDVLDEFCGRRPSNFIQYQKQWTFQEWLQVKSKCLSLCKAAIRNGETMCKEADIPTEFQQSFRDCLLARQLEIREKLKEDTCAISNSHLIDFDWQLKLVMGSDRMTDLKVPLAAVSFDINEGNERKQVLVEMNKEELAKFIIHLENANKAITQLQC